MTKIVLTGGPCAGTSTAMSWVQNVFSQMGYSVLFVPETASELTAGGVTPESCRSNIIYQQCLMQLQMEKERVYEKVASTMCTDKTLIVCEGGVLQQKASMSKSEFTEVLKALGTDEMTLRSRYDAVFHLRTAAKGAEAFYSTAKCLPRKESLAEAAEADEKISAAWKGHPSFHTIGNGGTFQQKMQCLIREIAQFLGEPLPYETERKFLIVYPDIAWLEHYPNCQHIEIIQTYLRSRGEDEVRVRERNVDGHSIYFQTMKRTYHGGTEVEVERRLTKDEYLRRLMDADTTKHQVRKTRYCFVFEKQHFEIDVYPFWNDKAIAKVAVQDAQAAVKFPPQIEMLSDVTTNAAYQNASIAAHLF